MKAALRNTRAKEKKLGGPKTILNVRRIAVFLAWVRSSLHIVKQLGVGVGTAYRAYQELSKIPEAEKHSRISIPQPPPED